MKSQRKGQGNLQCPICEGESLQRIFLYETRPAREQKYGFSNNSAYRREVMCCESCGHFTARHSIDMSKMYEGAYVDSLYEGLEGIRRRYDSIMLLKPNQSDNHGRTERIKSFFAKPGKVLDVGSGLCVFLRGMKLAGWDGVALDPDERAVKHAREVVDVKAVRADFMKAKVAGKFDLVTFNKVLEHTKDPVIMLRKAQENLKRGGLVYVEIPDGEMASRAGAERQEFYVEHWHAFSAASLALLMQRAGFSVLRLERLRDPSGKYTLWVMGYLATQ